MVHNSTFIEKRVFINGEEIIVKENKPAPNFKNTVEGKHGLERDAAIKILQTFADVPSKKNFLPKMELPQNLLQTFACVASEKKLPTKNGVASKFIANIRFFLLLYT